MSDSALLTVDLDALAHNYAFLRQQARGAETAPVVKADGYGVGAAAAAKRLWAEGARTFYVARLFEGEALRAALGDQAQIYVFDGATPGSAERLAAAKLTPVLNSLQQIEAWGPRPCALHIDTGMNRLGLRLEEAEGLHLNVELLISHLACAAEPDHPLNRAQLARFRQAEALFKGVRASFANSAGIFLGEDYLFDQVRPGVSLYGGGPQEVTDERLRTVATLEAPILQVRDVPAGDSIGYGAQFVAEAPMRVAIVAAGYADGLLRSSSPRGEVWLAGGRRRYLGRVSMDMIAIDVTDCAAAPGEMVELMGPHIPIDEAAARAGTSAYELLTGLGTRVVRRYLGAI